MKRQTTLVTAGFLAMIGFVATPCLGLDIEVSFSEEIASEPIDGRVILMLSKNDGEEPRFQVRPGVNAIQIFGVDVEGMGPGEEVRIDASVFGYPIHKPFYPNGGMG